MGLGGVSLRENLLASGDIMIAKTEAVNKWSELLLSIFELMEIVYESVPPFVTLLSKSIFPLFAWTGLVNIFNRVHEWTSTDDKGVYNWTKATTQSLGVTISNTVYTALKTLTNFHIMGLISIGKAFGPVSIASNVCVLGITGFDFWDNVNTLSKVEEGALKANRCLSVWKHMKKMVDSPTDRETNIKQYATMARSEPMTEGTKRIWTALTKYSDANAEALKTYVDTKINKWETKLANENLTHKRTWVGIAFDVTTFVLISGLLALPFLFASAHIMLTLSILGVASCTLDSLGFFVANFFKNHEVAKTPMPAALVVV